MQKLTYFPVQINNSASYNRKGKSLNIYPIWGLWASRRLQFDFWLIVAYNIG